MASPSSARTELTKVEEASTSLTGKGFVEMKQSALQQRLHSSELAGMSTAPVPASLRGTDTFQDPAISSDEEDWADAEEGPGEHGAPICRVWVLSAIEVRCT